MIQTKKGNFGCAMLNEVRSGGQELFLLEAIDQRLQIFNQQGLQNQIKLRMLLAPHPSSETAHFNAIESQNQANAEDDLLNRIHSVHFI